MKRTLLVTLLLSMAVLAGCADGGGEAPGEEETLVDEELEATDETGVIRGVVVDPTVTPVPDASVEIRSSGIETTTAEDGSFGFSDLEPGAYFLDVSKVGFDPVQASATVVAGVDRPPVVKIQISKNESAEPFHQTTEWSGHLRCGAAAVVTAFPCSIVRGTEDALGDYGTHVMEFDRLPTFIQSELVWDNTQPLGESLLYNYAHCCNNANIAENGTAMGPSPLAVNAHEAEMVDGDILEDGLEIRVFGAGFEPTPELLSPVGPFGVGVQVEQSLSAFTTQFFNFLPPEGWMFVEDGAPVVPS